MLVQSLGQGDSLDEEMANPLQYSCLGNPTDREKEKVEAETDFIFLGSKITANGDCSHEIKRRLLLGRKAMTVH